MEARHVLSLEEKEVNEGGMLKGRGTERAQIKLAK